MRQFETWYFVENGVLYKHYENDGHAALKRGLEAVNTPLCTIEEAKIKCPELLKKAGYEDGIR